MKTYLVVMLILQSIGLVSDHSKPPNPKTSAFAKLVVLGLLIWTVLLLLGCSRPPGMQEKVVGTVAVRVYTMPMSGADVVEFRLTDGTRCVMVQNAGGIACEWRAPGAPAYLEAE